MEMEERGRGPGRRRAWKEERRWRGRESRGRGQKDLRLKT